MLFDSPAGGRGDYTRGRGNADGWSYRFVFESDDKTGEIEGIRI